MVSPIWKYATYAIVVVASISILANIVLLHLTSGGAVAVMECKATLSHERKECKDYLIKQQSKMDKVTTNQSRMADELFKLVKNGKSVEEMRKFNNFAEQTGAPPQGVGGASSQD
jgi:2-C-methyl-D-erythritol 4-phosphate cytidylyltransferase